MSKIKINNEYAVRINHPEFGIFYFSYSSNNIKGETFVFTKNLSKVQTWKTIKFSDNQINVIISAMKFKTRNIYLSLDKNIENKTQDNIIKSRNKYYYVIDSSQDIKSKMLLLTADKNIKKLNDTLIEDSESIYNLYTNIKTNVITSNFKKINNCDVDFDKILKDSNDTLSAIQLQNDIQNELALKVNNYIDDISQYKKDNNILKEFECYTGIYLDVIDASYGFRKLKLKLLNNINNH